MQMQRDVKIPHFRPYDKVRDFLRRSIQALLPWNVVNALRRRSFMWRAFINYLLLRSRLVDRFFRVSIWPTALAIDGTNICNARCVFCAYPQMERPKKIMPVSEFKNFVSQYVRMGGRRVDLTPIVGDPFVDKYIFERLDYLASLPELRRFQFYTNAVLMKPQFHQRLAAYGSRLIVYCSFGGFDREAYDKVMGIDKFNEAVAAIQGLIETTRRTGSGMNIQVNLRVLPENNKGELWEYFLQARDQGLITIESVTQFDSWAGKIKDEDLSDAGLRPQPMPVKRGVCHRLITSPVVLADGRVNGCACRDVDASLIIGDLKQEPLTQILSGPALRELIEQHERGEFPEVCRRCTYYEALYPAWMRGPLFPFFSRLFSGRRKVQGQAGSRLSA